MAELCALYGYPAEVRVVLERTLDAIRAVEPRSVLLHGSASRGEFTWFRDESSRIRFASDLEMYVVTDHDVPSDLRGQMNAAVAAIAATVNDADEALFHIDLGFTTVDGLSRHPRTFRCWDTRTTGFTLLGDDLRTALPELDADSIDLRQLNEVPIHRLWEMVFRFPLGLLNGDSDPRAARLYSYVVARQALDLTTWLLPRFGIMVPTFRKRVAVWQDRHAELPLARYFDGESGPFLAECLRGKAALEFARPVHELHARTYEYFHSGLRLILGIAPSASLEQTTAAILAKGDIHWNVPGRRRRAYEASLALRSARGPMKAWRWWRAPKLPLQVATLLYMNEALSALLSGRDAKAALDATERLLGRLWYGFQPEPGSPAERLARARRGYVDYLVGSSRWFGPRREYLYAVIANG